ncbi:hypothetical protein DS67_00595 [Mesotoga sp. SC_4PWA21]|nr:hypothetical protein DS67_00595 [Mesotoga sp. SC_4PWA21]
MGSMNEVRRKGMTLMELLVALTVSTIVLLIVGIVSTQSLKISKMTNAAMALDEQIARLHSSINYIISRQFTALAPFEFDEDLPDEPIRTITLYSGVPDDSLEIQSAVSTITYDSDMKRVIHIYEDKSNNLVISVISENVMDFVFNPISSTSYLTYSATLSYYDLNNDLPILTRQAGGAVRFY